MESADNGKGYYPREARPPDFIIIGAMKAGTTSLFRRLGKLSDIDLPALKEPHFFSRPNTWSRGPQWYFELFQECRGIAGEASVTYSDPLVTPLIGERMFRTVPTARLIYALRHPVDRMRSHYRHRVLRARENRPFSDAISEPDNRYVRCSCYGRVLRDYLMHFPREHLLAYRLDALDSDNGQTWSQILEHIGAAQAYMPLDRHNETTAKVQFTPVLRWLWERDMIPTSRLPEPIQRVGRKLLTKPHRGQESLLASASEPVSKSVLDTLRRDQELVLDVTGSLHLTWSGL